MSWGVVTVTQGRETLAAAVASVRMQAGVETDHVVVGSPWPAGEPPAGARVIDLGSNLGPTVGRNTGARATTGELIFFLDDDARLTDPATLARLQERFAEDPALGMVQLRVDPEGGGPRPREWVPRLRPGDPTRSGPATVVWEGALALRRAAFEASGGWAEELFFVHEGAELAWRVLDAGYEVRYAGDLAVLHPNKGREPRPLTNYLSSRNRVWVARRNLPWPLGALYVLSFAARTWWRLRNRATWRGYRDGLREPCGPRRRLQVRTLWRMTRAGRPPIL